MVAVAGICTGNIFKTLLVLCDWYQQHTQLPSYPPFHNLQEGKTYTVVASNQKRLCPAALKDNSRLLFALGGTLVFGQSTLFEGIV